MPTAKRSKKPDDPITALELAAFKGPGKVNAAKVSDDDDDNSKGLFFVVTPTGNRRWVFRFTFAGKQHELFLGPETALSLSAARKEASKARKLVKQGMDPRHTMNAAARRRKQEEAAGVPTFGKLADDFLEALAPTFKNEKARQPWALSLNVYAAPIRKLQVNAIEPRHIVDLLKPIWFSKPETARRVRNRIEAVFGDAITRGLRDKTPIGTVIVQRNPALWKDNLDKSVLGRRNSAKTLARHHPALPHSQIADFMADLAKREGLAARAMELCILTATRTNEAIGSQWSEIDLKAKTWTIPAERMKAGREHVIPLTGPALAIVKGLERWPGSPFLFPGVSGEQHLSNMAMAMLLRRMGQSEVTVHGFRSTFRTWASECTQFPREIAELALAHQVGSEVERAYNRTTLLDKRRKLMDTWADYCAPAHVSRVVAFKRP